MTTRAKQAAHIRIERYDGDRTALRPLFALADDSAMQVATYIRHGVLLVAFHDDAIVGLIQIIRTHADNVHEIKSLAVHAIRQGEGIGRALVASALRHCRELGAQSVVVATATADINNLRFYQRVGFRMTHIVPDVFTEAAGYNAEASSDGIVLCDQVYFRFQLN